MTAITSCMKFYVNRLKIFDDLKNQAWAWEHLCKNRTLDWNRKEQLDLERDLSPG